MTTLSNIEIGAFDHGIQVKSALAPRDAKAASQSFYLRTVSWPKCSFSAPHRPQVSQLVMFPAKCHSVSLSSSMGSISRFAFMKTVSYGWTLVPR